MTVVDKFLERYSKEYDYYSQCATISARICESDLEQNGVRAIVTSRAKRPDRLSAKIEERNSKKQYRTVDAIYKDIVDLAGVRIALYFPGDLDEVTRLMKSKFTVLETRNFPQESKNPPYQKRFSGYAARHFRVNIKRSELPELDTRYSAAAVEIQVASVLIHAWAEVEHDLVYKPLSGKISEDEYAILDELNGLVLAGEIALERLQRSGELRLKVEGKGFRNHYELAGYIYGKVIDHDK